MKKDMYNGKLAKLIEMAVKDGEISPLENNVLLKAAAEQGVDPEEVAMVVNARLKELRAQKEGIEARIEAKKRRIAEKKGLAPTTDIEMNVVTVEKPKEDNSKCNKCGELFHPLSNVCSACGNIRMAENQKQENLHDLIHELEKIVAEILLCDKKENCDNNKSILELETKYEQTRRKVKLYYGQDLHVRDVLEDIHQNYLKNHHKAHTTIDKNTDKKGSILLAVIALAVISMVILFIFI